MDAKPAAASMTYVTRAVLEDYDYEHTDLDTDAAWHDLDLTGIIPVEAKVVFIHVKLRAATVGSFIGFKPAGDSAHYGQMQAHINVANKDIHGYFTIPLRGTGIVQYQASNVTWTFLRTIITGWLV